MLIPKVEGFKILGTIFSSSLFPNRAPAGHLTLTSYVGGERYPELASLPPEKLFALTCEDLRVLLGVRGKPTFQHSVFYPKAIPQYNVGYGRYRELMTEIEGKAPGLFFAGHLPRRHLAERHDRVRLQRGGPGRAMWHRSRRRQRAAPSLRVPHERVTRVSMNKGVLLVNLGSPDSPVGGGRAALSARVPDGRARAGRELAGAVLHRQLCHPALAPEAIGRGLSEDLDARRLPARGHQPQRAGQAPAAASPCRWSWRCAISTRPSRRRCAAWRERAWTKSC